MSHVCLAVQTVNYPGIALTYGEKGPALHVLLAQLDPTNPVYNTNARAFFNQYLTVSQAFNTVHGGPGTGLWTAAFSKPMLGDTCTDRRAASAAFFGQCIAVRTGQVCLLQQNLLLSMIRIVQYFKR